MLAAIQLHDEAFFRSKKIHDEPADPLLATEFHSTQLAVADVTPEKTLCIR